MIKIVLSYEDNYIDRVEKIKEEFFDDVFHQHDDRRQQITACKTGNLSDFQ